MISEYPSPAAHPLDRYTLSRMDAWMWLLLGLGSVAFAAVALGGQRMRRSRTSPASAPGQPIVMPTAAMEQVRMHITAGRKIQAIKELRDVATGPGTPLGLKEAKGIVDSMEAGHPVPIVSGDAGGESLAGRARAIRSAGNFGVAVAVVRTQTGMSQTEAERFVAVLDDPA